MLIFAVKVQPTDGSRPPWWVLLFLMLLESQSKKKRVLEKVVFAYLSDRTGGRGSRKVTALSLTCLMEKEGKSRKEDRAHVSLGNEKGRKRPLSWFTLS